jgi:phosphocarrier protein HPr
MIDRPSHSVATATRPGGADGPGAGFVNPWAECWGSEDTQPRSPVQMQVEARAMQHPRMESAAEAEPCDEAEAVATGEDGTLVRVLPVINNKGLHARASAKFVQTVERFKADVTVSRCGETVGGLSIMGLMMLAAARGTTVTVTAKGPEAQLCLDAIEALLADKFGEEA